MSKVLSVKEQFRSVSKWTEEQEKETHEALQVKISWLIPKEKEKKNEYSSAWKEIVQRYKCK